MGCYDRVFQCSNRNNSTQHKQCKHLTSISDVVNEVTSASDMMRTDYQQRIAVALTFGLVAWTPAFGQVSRATRSVEEESRIRGDGSSYLLSLITGLEVTGAGEVVVLDPQSQSLMVFDSTGSYRRKIGRSGNGPGEFSQPVFIGTRGDSVWVGDAAHRRITIFGPKGSVARTIPVPQGGSPSLLPTDDVLVVPAFALGPVEREYQFRVERLGAGSGEKVVVLDVSLQPRMFHLDLGTIRLVARQPFDDMQIINPSRDGNAVLFVDARATRTPREGVRVWKVDTDGRTIFDVSYPFARQPFPSSVVDAHVSRTAETIRRRMPDIPDVTLRGQLLQALYVPQYAPTVTRVLGAQDGSTWLRREESNSGSVRWTVLDRVGRIAYEVQLPAGAEVLWAKGAVVYAALTNEGNVPDIVRYRLR
jgi:hypothetical protein